MPDPITDELGVDDSILVPAQHLDVARIDVVRPVAAHESVFQSVSLKAFHRVPQLVCLDTVILQIMNVDIIGFRADLKYSRWVYRQFQPFVLIVELDQ